MRLKSVRLPQIVGIMLLASCAGGKTNKYSKSGTGEDKRNSIVRLEDNKANKSVDIYFGNELFTSYIYPDNIMKPCLWPVVAPKGIEVTRGFPMKIIAGESVDHPHHVGIWMNYGNVNGIDYWGHSEAIPPDLKHRYGSIRHLENISMESNGNQGSLSVRTEWTGGNRVQVREKIVYRFIDRGEIRIIDWVSTLTAQEDLTFGDTKEGMFAIRVGRQLELPSNEEVTLKDSHENPTQVRPDAGGLASGDYLSSEGKTGTEVWGTRARWMKLFGTFGSENVAVVIIDHRQNPGYPTYWHARGYGLFAANPLGWKDFTKGKERFNLSLRKGESVRFAYRTLLCTGKLDNETIDKLASEFSENNH